MFGLTTLGIFHTIISLIVVASGAIALILDGKISWDKQVGRIYVRSGSFREGTIPNT